MMMMINVFSHSALTETTGVRGQCSPLREEREKKTPILRNDHEDDTSDGDHRGDDDYHDYGNRLSRLTAEVCVRFCADSPASIRRELELRSDSQKFCQRR